MESALFGNRKKASLAWLKRDSRRKELVGESKVTETHTGLPNQEKTFAFNLSMVKR